MKNGRMNPIPFPAPVLNQQAVRDEQQRIVTAVQIAKQIMQLQVLAGLVPCPDCKGSPAWSMSPTLVPGQVRIECRCRCGGTGAVMPETEAIP